MQQQQKQQEPHMGFNGGGDSNRGLTRFWSAPTTWLDTLVQDLEDNPPSQNHCLPPPQHQQQQLQTLRNNNSTFYDATISSGAGPISGASSDLGLFRQNSSPAELLDHLTSSQVLGSDGFLPASFGVSGNFDYNLEFPATKRSLDSEFQQEQPKFPSQVKGEQSGVSSNFSDMEMEKLFEDSVPCRVRAKRGCATHPRSIAERVRRTRISDRIRKLQDLVPNMDKQTNTADMLEEAVEYVKLLQKQIKELSEHQQNCKCVARN